MLICSNSLKELSAQIRHEFNFKQEAEVMNRMQLSLKNHVREGELITVPNSIMATKKLLVRTTIYYNTPAQNAYYQSVTSAYTTEKY